MPQEPQETPQLTELLEAVQDDLQQRIYTALPGKINSYDATTQTAEVQILVKLPVVDPQGVVSFEEIPPLASVPIAFERGGGAFMSFPLAAGDNVMVQCCMHSIDNYYASDGSVIVDAGYLQMHDLSDAVAYPKFYPKSKALASADPNNFTLGRDGGCTLHFKPDDTIHLGADPAAEGVALGDTTKAEIEALRDTVNSLITAYNSHIHITTATVGASPTPGVISPTTSSATPPAVVGNVASTKVFAEE